MKPPTILANDAERVAALVALEILDTQPEAAFDGLTALTAAILGVPIALVSLVDANRQWFKSCFGLATTETPRDVSFCGHVVEREAPLVVTDALADPRFADNPLVTGGPRVRFYAGYPLRTSDGFVLGTLCAIDTSPRQPTPAQLAQLALLAAQASALLEARRERHAFALARATALDTVRRYDALFETLSEGVLVEDAQGAIVSANAAAEAILGLSVAEITGRHVQDPRWRRVDEQGQPFADAALPSAVALRTGARCANVVVGVLTPGGERTWLSVNAVPFGGDGTAGGRGVLSTFHDITLIKAAQAATERLSRQAHLVTTGTLAAGVGHEINNPLAFILANLEFAREELRAIAADAPPARVIELIAVLDEAREGAERIRKIVRGLRALAREETTPVPTDAGGAIALALNIAHHEIRGRATLTTRLGRTPAVLADESRLTQVLVNLFVNAAQAFATADPARNEIRVTTAHARDGRVTITVADNGPGIPQALHRRVFEPFFTTKPVGTGTGLGLSISQSLVHSLGGELTLASDGAHGTTFVVALPIAAEPLRGSFLPPPPPAQGRRGRVLVVDDERTILQAVRRLLQRDHEVVTLDDPLEAARRLEAGERFDVVLCDLMMPRLGGDALHARVRAVDAAMADRFVFMTGAANDLRLEGFLAAVPNERIEKPFSVQNLRGIVRRFCEANVARA